MRPKASVASLTTSKGPPHAIHQFDTGHLGTAFPGPRYRRWICASTPDFLSSELVRYRLVHFCNARRPVMAGTVDQTAAHRVVLRSSAQSERPVSGAVRMVRMSWGGGMLYRSNRGGSGNCSDSYPNWPLAKKENLPHLAFSIMGFRYNKHWKRTQRERSIKIDFFSDVTFHQN